jgi:hypothetical protein
MGKYKYYGRVITNFGKNVSKGGEAFIWIRNADNKPVICNVNPWSHSDAKYITTGSPLLGYTNKYTHIAEVVDYLPDVEDVKIVNGNIRYKGNPYTQTVEVGYQAPVTEHCPDTYYY